MPRFSRWLSAFAGVFKHICHQITFGADGAVPLLTVSNITSVVDELERWVTDRPWDAAPETTAAAPLVLATSIEAACPPGSRVWAHLLGARCQVLLHLAP